METAGLIDLQVNGYAGIDFNDDSITPDQVDHALRAMLRSGVTACLPTLITADEGVMRRRLLALDAAVDASRLGPLMVPGFHLEGPFLNPAPGYAGCHPAEAMIAPDAAVLGRLVAGLRRPVLLLTLAPEREGALAVIAAARAAGIVVAMGHTAADGTATDAGVRAGVSLSTHLGNALPQPQPKFLNPLMVQLAHDGLWASFIADGLHVPPDALKVMVRAKTAGRTILVTDATAAAGTEPGLYGFAGMAIEHCPDGSVRVPNTTRLAGSALMLDQAVRNMVGWGLAAPAEALAMASVHPGAAIAPALDWHGIRLAEFRVGWGEDLRVTSMQSGSADIALI